MNLAEMIKLGSVGYKPADIKRFNESKIDSKDLIELAKNGYSVSDVDELIKSAQEAEQVQPETDNQVVPAQDEKPGEEANENKELTSLKQELDETKKKLEKLQSQNAFQNLGPVDDTSNEDKFKDALRNLY